MHSWYSVFIMKAQCLIYSHPFMTSFVTKRVLIIVDLEYPEICLNYVMVLLCPSLAKYVSRFELHQLLVK